MIPQSQGKNQLDLTHGAFFDGGRLRVLSIAEFLANDEVQRIARPRRGRHDDRAERQEIPLRQSWYPCW
jgi:hypothetical protein